MAEIFETAGTHLRAGVQYQQKLNTRIDMTPMVDLGFLLIAFFVMTTELSRPSVINLAMPKDGPPILLGNSNALTILLAADDRVYYYEGNWKDAIAKKEIFKSSLSVNDGIGKVIREKQQWLDKHNIKEGRNGLMLLIKATKQASYHNVIKALDEALINVVSKYTILTADPEEMIWMKTQSK